MEAPKEIYVHEVSAQELSEPKLNEYHIKYIRADLTELTVEDIGIIHGFLLDGLNYTEVLRRFNKQRNKK